MKSPDRLELVTSDGRPAKASLPLRQDIEARYKDENLITPQVTLAVRRAKWNIPRHVQTIAHLKSASGQITEVKTTHYGKGFYGYVETIFSPNNPSTPIDSKTGWGCTRHDIHVIDDGKDGGIKLQGFIYHSGMHNKKQISTPSG